MKRLWTQEELIEHWTLTPDELALLGNKVGATRLGFVVLLRAFQHEGAFPVGKHEVPAPVVAFLARQVGVPAAAYLEYDWGGRAIKYHRAQVREHLGVREATIADAEVVAGWLVAHVLDQQHQPDALRAAAQGRFRALRLEPPTPKQLARLIRSALHTWEARLFATTLARLAPATVAALDALVATRPDEVAAGTTDGRAVPETSAFAVLRADPGAVGLASVAAESAKLATLRALDLPPTSSTPSGRRCWRSTASAPAPRGRGNCAPTRRGCAPRSWPPSAPCAPARSSTGWSSCCSTSSSA